MMSKLFKSQEKYFASLWKASDLCPFLGIGVSTHPICYIAISAKSSLPLTNPAQTISYATKQYDGRSSRSDKDVLTIITYISEAFDSNFIKRLITLNISKFFDKSLLNILSRYRISGRHFPICKLFLSDISMNIGAVGEFSEIL